MQKVFCRADLIAVRVKTSRHVFVFRFCSKCSISEILIHRLFSDECLKKGKKYQSDNHNQMSKTNCTLCVLLSLSRRFFPDLLFTWLVKLAVDGYFQMIFKLCNTD